MTPFFSLRNARDCILGTIALFFLFKVSREYFFFPKSTFGYSAAALWPMSGICVAVLLRFGWRLFPSIFTARLLASSLWTNPKDLHDLLSLRAISPDYYIYPLAYALTALAGFFLITRIFRIPGRVRHLKDLILLLLVAAPLIALVYPLVGTLATTKLFTSMNKLSLERFVLAWSGNLLGLIIFAPVTRILLYREPLLRKGVLPRTFATLFLTLIATLVPLYQKFDVGSSYPLTFLPFPVLMWIALILGYAPTTLANAIISLFIARITIDGRGPLVPGNTPLETLLQLTMYTALLTASSLIIAKLMDERRAESEKKDLMIETAGLVLWEWSSHQGLHLSDSQFMVRLGLDPQKVVSPRTWRHHLSKDDFARLPWNHPEEKIKSGDQFKMEIPFHSGAASEPIFLKITGMVQETNPNSKAHKMMGVIQDISDSKRAAQLTLKEALNAAELRRIRTSLNPHFLFNSLNTIKSLITENSSKARQAVIDLSSLLRSSLRVTRSDFVPLKEELLIIRSYLELQKIRHEERMDYLFEEDPSCNEFPLPPMLFHQLVENAVKHGVESSPEKTSILIRTAHQGKRVVLSVENTGQLPEKYDDGIGLRSIRSELSSIYGDTAFFSLTAITDDRVRAEIIFQSQSSTALTSAT
jgi:integral membrane sensor domain MASE1